MKFENTEVWGFEHAFRGMRNPMNSWNKSDSFYGCNNTINGEYKKCVHCFEAIECNQFEKQYVLGEKDIELAQKLIKAGPEHRKFLRQIMVSVDITAPIYWWKEADTYKIGTTANSTSTMHKLTSQPITIDCFEIDDYQPDLVWLDYIDITGDTPSHITESVDDIVAGEGLYYEETIINLLESLRKKYLETKDKRYWKELIRWLPESWLQTRTVTMNYENLYSMIRQRKNHKLNEWSGKDNDKLPNFISWVKTLPYSKELLFYGLSEGSNE